MGKRKHRRARVRDLWKELLAHWWTAAAAWAHARKTGKTPARVRVMKGFPCIVNIPKLSLSIQAADYDGWAVVCPPSARPQILQSFNRAEEKCLTQQPDQIPSLADASHTVLLCGLPTSLAFQPDSQNRYVCPWAPRIINTYNTICIWKTLESC